MAENNAHHGAGGSAKKGRRPLKIKIGEEPNPPDLEKYDLLITGLNNAYVNHRLIYPRSNYYQHCR